MQILWGFGFVKYGWTPCGGLSRSTPQANCLGEKLGDH